MKKYIYIVCILMGCTLLAYFPAEKAIENDAQNVIEEDSVKYREEAIRKLDEVFEGSTLDNFGCVLYYNTIPNFKFVSPSEKKQFFPKDELNELLGIKETKCIYHLAPDVINIFNSLDFQTMTNSIILANIDRGEKKWNKAFDGFGQMLSNHFWQGGWLIGYAYRESEDSYVCFLVYPEWIGFLDNRNVTNKEISKELEKALNFWVNNEKSFLYGYVKEEYASKFHTLIRGNIQAEHYGIEEDNSDEIKAYGGISDLVGIAGCRTQMTSTPSKKYVLKYHNQYEEYARETYISEKRESLLLKLSVIGFILLVIWLALVWIYLKEKKRLNESVLQRIIRLSNPSLYMKNYDSEKIEIANEIYQKALATNEGDEDAILSLADQIESNLGMSLVEHEEIKKLKKECRPNNFTNPYNAEKLAKANRIYQALLNEKIRYRDYLSLKIESDKLCNKI